MSEQRSQRDNPHRQQSGAVAKQNLHLGEVTVVRVPACEIVIDAG